MSLDKKLSLIRYNEESAESVLISSLKDVPKAKKGERLWLSCVGCRGDLDFIEKLSKTYNLHPLSKEVVKDENALPTMMYHEHYASLVVKSLYYDEEKKSAYSKHVTIFVFKHMIITFEDEETGIFDFVKSRLLSGNIGKLKKSDSDYLLYALLDTLVDHYFTFLQYMGERIDALEERLTETPDKSTMQLIQRFTKELFFLRKNIFPFREIVLRMIKWDAGVVHEETRLYFRDLETHVLHSIETLRTFQDILANMFDIYMSSINTRTNDTMRVLTVVSTIFIPLTFISGLYGMNFDTSVSPFNMPELRAYFGYPAVILVMLLIVFGMLIFFKKNKWL